MNILKSMAALGFTLLLVMGYIKIEADIAGSSKAVNSSAVEKPQNSFDVITPVSIELMDKARVPEFYNTKYRLFRFNEPGNTMDPGENKAICGWTTNL
jgi:hypothetical protein